MARSTSLNTGRAVREAAREGAWTGPTAGLAPGYVQTNVVILPAAYAFDFLRFCLRNPKPCPVVDVTGVGEPHPDPAVAAGADLRTDVPRYRVYRNGELVEERTDIRDLWQEDFVGVLLGCSFTFEQALLAAGVPVRHVECGCNVPMYITHHETRPAGPFHGPLVVSMRPIPGHQVTRAVEVTARFPQTHGAPVYIGDPRGLGIADLNRPDFGDPVPLHPGEVPVFWACGVTTHLAVMNARLPVVITHAPGHMFVTDLTMDDGR